MHLFCLFSCCCSSEFITGCRTDAADDSQCCRNGVNSHGIAPRMSTSGIYTSHALQHKSAYPVLAACSCMPALMISDCCFGCKLRTLASSAMAQKAQRRESKGVPPIYRELSPRAGPEIALPIGAISRLECHRIGILNTLKMR
jgi:hypothetical protein